MMILILVLTELVILYYREAKVLEHLIAGKMLSIEMNDRKSK
jgi:hypothetical protein